MFRQIERGTKKSNQDLKEKYIEKLKIIPSFAAYVGNALDINNY